MIQHFISIHFNCWDQNHDGRNLKPEWIDYRMGLMCRYNLPSLAQQTNSDFVVRIFCMESTRRFIEESYKKHATGDVPRLIFVFNKSEDIESRQLSPNTTRVLDTRLDSDDMFREDAIEIIKANSNNCEAVIPSFGYLYDRPTLRKFYWRSPPYYTFCVTPETWLNGYHKWYRTDRNLTSHGQVIDKFDSVIIKEPIFCALSHGPNTLNQKTRGVGQHIWWPHHKKLILQRFGIY